HQCAAPAGRVTLRWRALATKPLDEPVGDCPHQILLRREIVMEGRRIDLRARRDVACAETLEAIRRQRLERDVDDELAPFIGRKTGSSSRHEPSSTMPGY